MMNSHNNRAPYWHEDCLSVTTLLALSLTDSDIKKYKEQFTETHEGDSSDPVFVFMKYHEICHDNGDFEKKFSKNLTKKFPMSTCNVRSLDVEKIKLLYEESSFPISILWSALSSEKDEVRLLGRYFVHEIIWKAIQNTFLKNNNSSRNTEKLKILENENKTLKSKIVNLMSQLNIKDKTIENLRLVTIRLESQIKEIQNLNYNKNRLRREIKKLSYELEQERQNVRLLSQQKNVA